jgi:Tat protein secretion system quality control protein TatD with DNase activity
MRVVGLDFSPHIVRGKDMPEEHYRDVQRQVFRQQIELAIEADLPLNVHSRWQYLKTFLIYIRRVNMPLLDRQGIMP